MLTHFLAILGIAVGCVVWWALQQASGGERKPDCGHGEGGCGSCSSRTDQCGAVDASPRP